MLVLRHSAAAAVGQGPASASWWCSSSAVRQPTTCSARKRAKRPGNFEVKVRRCISHIQKGIHDIERMLNECDVTCVRNGSASPRLPTCASMHGVSGFRRKYLRQHGRSAFTRSHRTRTTVRNAVLDVLFGLCLWMRSCTQNQCDSSTSHPPILASVRFLNIGQYHSIPQYRLKSVRFVNIASVRQAILT